MRYAMYVSRRRKILRERMMAVTMVPMPSCRGETENQGRLATGSLTAATAAALPPLAPCTGFSGAAHC